MEKQISARLMEIVMNAIETFAAVRYGTRASAFLAAVLTLYVNAEGGMVAGRKIAKTCLANCATCWLPEEMQDEISVLMESEALWEILGFCFLRARQNGVAAFRGDMSRQFRATDERSQASQAANRKFQTFAGFGMRANASGKSDAHSGLVWNAEHDGGQIAWTSAC